MTDTPTVNVVDDNSAVRTSVRALLNSAGIAVRTFASPEEFLEQFDPDRPGCLLLDIRLRRASGLDLQDELRRRHATLPVIIITGYATVPTTVRALKSGAFDFLQKPVVPRHLIDRVNAAIERDRRTRELVAAHDAVKRRLARLTPRERQVLDLLIEGKTSKEISSALNISVRTIEGHRHMVLMKMKVSTAAELVRAVMHSEVP